MGKLDELLEKKKKSNPLINSVKSGNIDSKKIIKEDVPMQTNLEGNTTLKLRTECISFMSGMSKEYGVKKEELIELICDSYEG